MSREPQDVELFNGRLDAEKVAVLGRELFDARGVDAYFLCGPGTMIETRARRVGRAGRRAGAYSQRAFRERCEAGSQAEA